MYTRKSQDNCDYSLFGYIYVVVQPVATS
jgi:hypothetical protein